MGRPYRAAHKAFLGVRWLSTDVVEPGLGVVGVHGGVKFYHGAAHATRAYVERDRSRYGDWRRENPRIAEILLVLSWTGLRWSEVRAVRVDDLMQVPTPGLMIRRAAPEGVGTKSTKGRRSRRVPLANRVLPLVLAMAEGKEPGDLLFTTAGGAQLHRTATLRAVNWRRTGR